MDARAGPMAKYDLDTRMRETSTRCYRERHVGVGPLQVSSSRIALATVTASGFVSRTPNWAAPWG